jgi:hypothetical protein
MLSTTTVVTRTRLSVIRTLPAFVRWSYLHNPGAVGAVTSAVAHGVAAFCWRLPMSERWVTGCTQRTPSLSLSCDTFHWVWTCLVFCRWEILKAFLSRLGSGASQQTVHKEWCQLMQTAILSDVLVVDKWRFRGNGRNHNWFRRWVRVWSYSETSGYVYHTTWCL